MPKAVVSHGENGTKCPGLRSNTLPVFAADHNYCLIILVGALGKALTLKVEYEQGSVCLCPSCSITQQSLGTNARNA